jgi:hypothetical protein
MPFVYHVSSAGSTSLTSSGTPNTETTVASLRAGSGRMSFLQEVNLMGRGAGLTAISGILLKVRYWTTVSTGGTSVTPAPRTTGAPASKAAAVIAGSITPGTVDGGIRLSLSCGAAGPGGWVAPNADSAIDAGEAGSADCLDFYTQSGTASLVHDVSFAFFE